LRAGGKIPAVHENVRRAPLSVRHLPRQPQSRKGLSFPGAKENPKIQCLEDFLTG
jgi:hypothetical protein